MADDPIQAAATAEIQQRASRNRSVDIDTLAKASGANAVDELTRIRHEMTAIRLLLAHLVAKTK